MKLLIFFSDFLKIVRPFKIGILSRRSLYACVRDDTDDHSYNLVFFSFLAVIK